MVLKIILCGMFFLLVIVFIISKSFLFIGLFCVWFFGCWFVGWFFVCFVILFGCWVSWFGWSEVEGGLVWYDVCFVDVFDIGGEWGIVDFEGDCILFQIYGENFVLQMVMVVLWQFQCYFGGFVDGVFELFICE